MMENLDRLLAAGLPIFDLNSENLDRSDFSHTPLGPRDAWPASLQCLVASCILPIPHGAALFWGNDLCIVHNLAWGKATGNLDGQGARAYDSFSEDAIGALKNAVRGRTVKVDCGLFLDKTADLGPGAAVLLSTLLDHEGVRQGVYAQVLHAPAVHKEPPLAGLEARLRDHPVRQTKKEGAQQTRGSTQVDAKQTQLFQRFAELLPNGLAILDSDAEAVFVNDGFFKLTTNRTSQDFRAWPESIHPMDYERVMDVYRKAFSSRQELRVEFRCTGSTSIEDEEWRLFLLRPLSDEKEAGFICAMVDITEIKRAQLTQERTAHEAQERKEQQERFIDMVSHEIRNPLSAVLHLAEEIKDVARDIAANVDPHGRVKEQISDVLDAADTILICVSHQNVLVDDILSFSKLDSMMLTLVPREVRPKWDFSKALKVFHSEFKAKDIKFHYAMDVSYDEQEVDFVVADLNRMKQVLVNLITNAIKFTSKKEGERTITVSMGASPKRPSSYPPSVIFFSEDDNVFRIDSTMTAEWGTGPTLYIMVAVRDSGIGISAEGQEKLFERFRQATPKTQEKYGGSGLGLFISRKLCQLHGGDIGVSSKEGEDSTFGFYFKVRRSDGSSEGGRPPFGSRASSETLNLPMRPAYSRSNSALKEIKERPDERSKLGSRETLSTRKGVDIDEVDESLKNPPTEFREEAHPQSSKDERYEETSAIVSNIKSSSPGTKAVEEHRAELEERETERQQRKSEETAKLQSQSPSKGRRTLLLVEDNLINQKVLRRQLQSRGFEVFVANNGQEAVDAVEARGRIKSDGSAPRNYFDCILMDQEMPVKDGNTATTEIRELQEHNKAGRSPILGVSANVREAQISSMLEAGMDAYISKPFKVEDLVKKIKSIVPAD